MFLRCNTVSVPRKRSRGTLGYVHKPFQIMNVFAIFMNLVPVFDVSAQLPLEVLGTSKHAHCANYTPAQRYAIVAAKKVTANFAQIFYFT